MPDAPPPEPTGEEDRVRSLDARFGAIESKQAEHDGKLDQILSKLTGDATGASQPGKVTEAASAPADMAEQMRQAVRDVNAEAAAAAKDKPAAPDPEQTPREVMVKGKDRLQRALFGGDKK